MKRSKRSYQASVSTDNEAKSLEVEDRLSSLPDAIILHILSFIDTKLAVQTTILSKRWLHLWKYLPSLNIYSNSFPDKSLFDHFISQFLKSHNTSTVYTLIFHDSSRFVHSTSSVVVRDVKHHVVSRQIQHVDLRLAFRHPLEMYNSPSNCLFSCKTLRTLTLHGFVITLSSLNLPSLNTLCLRDVKFDFDDPLINILFRCPSSEHLDLSYCEGGYSRDESLDFRCFKNTAYFSTLKTLRLYSTVFLSWHQDENSPLDVFSGFVSLEDLEISYCVVYFPNDFIISCPRLFNLKLLHWEFWHLEKPKIIVSARRLASFKFEMCGFFDRAALVLDNTTSLQVVDFQMTKGYCHGIPSKKWKEDNFRMIVNLFESLSSVKSLYLTLDTIKVFSLFTDMLKNKISPLYNLEILKVRVLRSNKVENFQIPLEVIRYLSSGSSKLKEIDVVIVGLDQYLSRN